MRSATLDREKAREASTGRIVDEENEARGIGTIREHPRSRVEKLKTSAGAVPIHSFHAGHFRVLLEIVDARLLVLVLEVGLGTTSYRDF